MTDYNLMNPQTKSSNLLSEKKMKKINIEVNCKIANNASPTPKAILGVKYY